MEHCELLIIGAGAAGLSAAIAAKKAGAGRVLIADSRAYPGGILPQCVHRGFGTGQNGAQYTAGLLGELGTEVELRLCCAVLSVSEDKRALLSDARHGEYYLGFDALIFAGGSYEIPLGALPIAGTRPAGIYTAGQMQELINLHGYSPEGPAVILGSGDIGLIMAWQLAELGVDTSLVEKEPHPGGMARNLRLLDGLDVKFIFSNSIREILGEAQIEGVVLNDGTHLPCRTLLVAAGLRCEREPVKGLEDKKWLWLCGNCTRIHSMIESVIKEGREAGANAAAFLNAMRGKP